MKKIIFLIIILCFPLFVYADGTDKYYIEANILKNGDMEVKELKILSGVYNGINTRLKFTNPSLREFKGELIDFEGSLIYNATNLSDIKIYGVNYDSKDFSIINNASRTLFVKNQYANIGDYGYYWDMDYYNYKIFMPSNYNQASLITYTLKDVVVIHNDVAEIAWDFIGSDYEENINELIIVINLPSDSNELRVFSHGPVTGYNDIINKKQVKAVYSNLPAYQAIDVRVVFDKNLVFEGNKYSDVDGLEKILAVEKMRAEKANDLRNAAKTKITFIKIYFYIDLILLFVAGIYYYLKHDKENQAKFVGQYYREFIEDYNVEVVDYLMKKSITPNAMSASILNLIYKKNIKVEKLKDERGKDLFLFTKLSDSNNESEIYLLKFLFEIIGNGQTFSDKELQDYAKSTKTYSTFTSSYSAWKQKVIDEGKKQNFWDNNNLKIILIIFAIVSLGIFYLIVNSISSDLISYLGTLGIIHLIFIIYLVSSKKRSAKGNEDYAKWSAFRNFLKDFGQFKDKDLPEIILWEKYLVYATIFGLAKKVQSAMNVKIKEMNLDQTYGGRFNLFDYMLINNMVNSSVSSAINAASVTASQVAASRMSSSGGFGGGSSFGGGGFGGGGSGGGRF